MNTHDSESVADETTAQADTPSVADETDDRPSNDDTGTTADRFVYQADRDEPPSQAVVRAVAARSDVDDVMAVAATFEPLYDAIDPAALDALFESTRTIDRQNGSVSFTYAGYQVTVDTSGRVELVSGE